MMIDAEPLKPYLAAVAKAREDWESVGAASMPRLRRREASCSP